MSLWDAADWVPAWNWWTMPVTVVGDAREDDMERLATIHADAFPGAAWSASDLAALLREETVFGLVVRRANFFGTRSAVAFVLASLVAGEAEILTIAVSRAVQGRGFGRALLATHLARLASRGARTVFLEVEEGNLPALKLYRAFGFVETGRRDGYYRKPDGRRVAALTMSRALG